ncbi:MAG: DNA repair protein RadC [Desulfuromonadia bacterium]
MKGGIREWPVDERPREKLLRLGVEHLTEAELIAIILRSGDAAGGSAVDLGRELLVRYEGLAGLARLSLSELNRVRGVGIAKGASLLAAFELGRRLVTSADVWEGERFSSPEQIFRHFRYRLAGLMKERFYTILLDTKNRIIREEMISEGSLSQSIVHPREVFLPAVRESASAVLLVHNHPSGDPTPSREDREITTRLREGGELLGIRVLDHVIIGTAGYYSFSAQGIL